jgi:hypothetical protein
LVTGVEFYDFGARSRRPESARVFSAIVAGELETPADRSFFSELGNIAAVVLGWAAFVLFVFVPATQLIALCLCGIALLLQRNPVTDNEDVAVDAALQLVA